MTVFNNRLAKSWKCELSPAHHWAHHGIHIINTYFLIWVEVKKMKTALETYNFFRPGFNPVFKSLQGWSCIVPHGTNPFPFYRNTNSETFKRYIFDSSSGWRLEFLLTQHPFCLGWRISVWFSSGEPPSKPRLIIHEACMMFTFLHITSTPTLLSSLPPCFPSLSSSNEQCFALLCWPLCVLFFLPVTLPSLPLLG